MALKRLSLSHFDAEGLKNNKPIWGLNSVAESDLRAVGEIHLSIKQSNGNGSPDPLYMPVTWLPRELTATITRRRLLESSEFRRACHNGLITLISKEDAMRMLEQPGARAEQKRLDAEKSHVTQVGAARTISKKLVSVTKTETNGEEEDEDDGLNKTRVYDFEDEDDERTIDSAKMKIGATVDEYQPGISQSFKMWVDRQNADNNDAQTRTLLKGRQKFSLRELRFLSRTLRSTLQRSHKFVQARLDKKLAARAAKNA